MEIYGAETDISYIEKKKVVIIWEECSWIGIAKCAEMHTVL